MLALPKKRDNSLLTHFLTADNPHTKMQWYNRIRKIQQMGNVTLALKKEEKYFHIWTPWFLYKDAKTPVQPEPPGLIMPDHQTP